MEADGWMKEEQAMANIGAGGLLIFRFSGNPFLEITS